MSNHQLGRSQVGLAERAAILVIGLCYGICATLLIPSTLSGFAEYEHALPAAYGMARTSSIIALIAGCVAAAAFLKASVRLILVTLVATLVAGVAGLLGAAMTDTPTAATVVLPTILFVVAGPVLVASGAGTIIPSGIVGPIAAGVLVLAAMAAGAVGAFLAISDDIAVVRGVLGAVAVGMLLVAAVITWSARRSASLIQA